MCGLPPQPHALRRPQSLVLPSITTVIIPLVYCFSLSLSLSLCMCVCGLSASLSEVHRAIRLLSNGKAPGADCLPAELFKQGGMRLTHLLVHLFSLVWREEEVPQDFKDASIIHLYKRKGDHACCDNHRGISLLSVAGKVLTCVLLNRLPAHVDQ